MTLIRYDAAIIDAFPLLVSGIVVGRNLRNGPATPALQAEYLAAQQQVIADMTGVALGDVPALSAWRTAFRRFGVEPTKYRCAAEALIRRLVKKGDLPCVNALVDIGNLVSIRYALPIAVFDRRQILGPLTIHFADGGERYTELNQNEELHPYEGEVVFTDATGLVFARRWCWRQSAPSAAQLDTADILVTIEAQHEAGRAAVMAALADFADLAQRYLGGQYHTALLDAQQPGLSQPSW